MKVYFSGGDNWYPAIIGSKAVVLLTYKLVFDLRRENILQNESLKEDQVL